MRALHLNFLLHYPYNLHEAAKWDRGYFGGEASFKQYNTDCCLPLLALLERNTQRLPKFRASLAVSGVWLEQAERWSPELIRRIRKLIDKGSVRLVAMPYYYSMSAFYNLDELEFQVRLAQEKYDYFFGAQTEVLMFPGYCYHNRLASWAEKHGFKLVLAGNADDSLGWRNSNQMYAAKNCQDLNAAFLNSKITELIVSANKNICEQIQQEVKTEEAAFDFNSNDLNSAVVRKQHIKTETKTIFSAKLFQKQLDLEFLRGGLINIYLPAQVFLKWRDRSLLGFFDDIFKNWAQLPGNRLINVNDLIEASVKSEISIKKTVSEAGESAQDYQLPIFWTASQDEISKKVYNLYDKTIQTDNRDLHLEFARLTTLDYAQNNIDRLQLATNDFTSKIEKYLIENHDGQQVQQKGVAVGTKVNVQFDQKAREAKFRREELLQFYREANADKPNALSWGEDDMDDMEATIQVLAQRIKQDRAHNRDLSDLEEAEVVEDMWMDSSAGSDDEVHVGDDGPETTEDLQDIPDVEEIINEPIEEERFTAEPQVKTAKKRKKIVIS